MERQCSKTYGSGLREVGNVGRHTTSSIAGSAAWGAMGGRLAGMGEYPGQVLRQAVYLEVRAKGGRWLGPFSAVLPQTMRGHAFPPEYYLSALCGLLFFFFFFFFFLAHQSTCASHATYLPYDLLLPSQSASPPGNPFSMAARLFLLHSPKKERCSGSLGVS
jgi:hypothetical protein